jgi:hypothetical protein
MVAKPETRTAGIVQLRIGNTYCEVLTLMEFGICEVGHEWSGEDTIFTLQRRKTPTYQPMPMMKLRETALLA